MITWEVGVQFISGWEITKLIDIRIRLSILLPPLVMKGRLPVEIHDAGGELCTDLRCGQESLVIF